MTNAWKNLVPAKIGKWTGTSDTITLDLACVKSVLIGGESGSGKSCLIRHILATLTREHTPEEVRLLIADPKIVEYSDYEDSPYLLRPVVTDVEHIAETFEWLFAEYERRFNLFGKYGCRNIVTFNEAVCAGTIPEEKLPNIVFVIDEFADFLIQDFENFEASIARLAALSRAYGIFLVLSTQHTDPKCVTELVKANLNARIAFRTGTAKASKIILEQSGAESLREREFLYSPDATTPESPPVIKLRAPELSEES